MDRKEIEQNIEKMITASKVAAKLKISGLPVPQKPDFLDSNITIFDEWDRLKKEYGGIANIPFNELGEYLDKWSNLISYARWTEAVADIKQATSREIRDTVEKQLYVLQDGGRELRAASVQTEPIYIQWENKFVEDYAYYVAVKGLREGYECRANSISREITRRTTEFSDNRRSFNRGGA
jgi:hypothetical protein